MSTRWVPYGAPDTITCQTCGRVITRTGPRQRFCGRACMNKAYYAKRKEENMPRLPDVDIVDNPRASKPITDPRIGQAVSRVLAKRSTMNDMQAFGRVSRAYFEANPAELAKMTAWYEKL